MRNRPCQREPAVMQSGFCISSRAGKKPTALLQAGDGFLLPEQDKGPDRGAGFVIRALALCPSFHSRGQETLPSFPDLIQRLIRIIPTVLICVSIARISLSTASLVLVFVAVVVPGIRVQREDG